MNTVPFDEHFEQAVIISVLTDPTLLARIGNLLEVSDFYKDRHREIWKAINEIEVDNLDSLAVKDRLTDNTKEYFQYLVNNSEQIVPTISNAVYYAETVKEKSKLRAGINLGQEIAALCYTPNVDAEEAMQQLEDKFAQFLERRVHENVSESTKESFKKFMEQLGTVKEKEHGIRSGFMAIDMMLHRLEGLIILAARPGTGKTALAINIARNVAEHKPVVFFSLEQSQEQVFERVLAAEAEVSLEEIRTGAFLADQDSIERVGEAEGRLLRVFDNLHVDERAEIPTSYITSVSRAKKLEHGDIGLIVVDYLHIVRLAERNLVDALEEATRQLRNLGKELGCPVLLLSQLSRQPENTTSSDGNRTRRRPELSDLRSSGGIEQTADVVIFLYRESYYDQTGYLPDEDEVEVIVKKNRNGRTGISTMAWVPKFVKFKDISMGW